MQNYAVFWRSKREVSLFLKCVWMRFQRPGQLTSLIEDGEEGRANHDADHEAGEHHAQGGGAGVQDWGPEENEDVHAGLQQGLARAQQQNLVWEAF